MKIRPLPYLILVILTSWLTPLWAQEDTGLKREDRDIPVIEERKIKIGDVLLYRVIEDKDPLIPLPVSANGTINLPYHGSVPAAGQTPEELARHIQNLLEDGLYKTATVILIVEASPGAREVGTVYLSGRVNRVGPVEIDLAKENTISKVILSVGGFSDFANKRRVLIIRNNPSTDENERIEVDVQTILEDGKLENDVEVQDGDFIIVPQRLLNW